VTVDDASRSLPGPTTSIIGHRSGDAGFTLIELLVVLSILVVVMGGLGTMFVSAVNSQTDQTNRVQAQQAARLSLNKLRWEISCASAVTASLATGDSLTVSLPSYCPNSPNTSLTLAVTLPAATGIITVASTSFFNPTSNVITIGGSGTVTCTGRSATTFTGCTGGTGTFASGTNVTSAVTWCATATGPPYSLKRYVGDASIASPSPGGTCSGTSGTTWTTSLESKTVFGYNRGSFVPAPTFALAATGGSLKAGPFAYDVTAILSDGTELSGTIGRTTIAKDATNVLTLTWAAPSVLPVGTSVSSYNVYGRDDGSATVQGLRLLGSTSPGARTFPDNGSLDTSTINTGPPLATVSVTLTTDRTPATTSQQFSFSDSISLRNSGRF
jgi:prepilin-type N-terminal cleavage/methylation domain-containing protein